MKKLLSALLVIITLLSACKKDNEDPHEYRLADGVFILNQGAFNQDNASLTYFDPSEDTTSQGIFHSTNGASLGDVAQSIIVLDDRSFIVVNNSGLVYCIDNKSGQVLGKITGFTSPRNMLVINKQKAYVSDLYSQSITIVNPSTFEITGEIPVERTSEGMLLIGNKAYVANYSAWSQDKINNVVLVIDAQTDELLDTIPVGIEPHSMVADENNNFWVLCSGGYDNAEFPSLWKISGENGMVIQKFTFGVLESNPSSLEINGAGNRLFFLNNGLYSMSVTDVQLPSTPLLNPGGDQFFAFLGIDPSNNDIYIGDPKDYQSFGMVYRYKADATLLNQIDAGIIPAAFGFNY